MWLFLIRKLFSRNQHKWHKWNISFVAKFELTIMRDTKCGWCLIIYTHQVFQGKNIQYQFMILQHKLYIKKQEKCICPWNSNNIKIFKYKLLSENVINNAIIFFRKKREREKMLLFAKIYNIIYSIFLRCLLLQLKINIWINFRTKDPSDYRPFG